MLVKPIDKAEQKVEPPKPKVLNSLAGPKIAFLIVLLLVGFIVVSRRQAMEVKKPLKLQEKPTPQVETVLKPQQIVSAESLDQTKEQLLGASKEKSKEISGIVLSEATKRVMPIASKGAELAADYVYQNTIEEVIKRLIEILPARRQEVLEEWLKKSQ